MVRALGFYACRPELEPPRMHMRMMCTKVGKEPMTLGVMMETGDHRGLPA